MSNASDLNLLYSEEVQSKMAKIATKAASSVHYRARMEAYSCNERLGSRDGAAEIIGIDRTRLARIELGTIVPYPEEVIMMADAYNAPELMNHYCTKECPIGRRIIPQAEPIHFDRLTIKVSNAVENCMDAGKTMRAIAGSGNFTERDVAELHEVLKTLKRVSQVAAEMEIWIQKHARSGAN